ncbi:MAG TPA: hypothetical protein VGH87_04835 [Polyangiaceae bacterium]
MRFHTLFLAALVTACGDASTGTDGEGVAAVSDDNLNGIWSNDTVIDSWSAVGIRMHLGSDVRTLTLSGESLSGPGVSLTIDPKGYYASDDVMDGTIDGKAVHLARDTTSKGPIVLSFPGNEPYRAFLTDVILPEAQRDRESYTIMHTTEMNAWLHSCELYKHGSWQSKYLAGTTYAERNAAFSKIVSAVSNIKTTPRQMTHESKFTSAVTANLKDPSLAGLAISTFGMYFTTAAGRGLRIPMTSDSTAYFITDRPSRGALIGVVAMATPLHGPLASTFGRQLLDMGAMPTSDDSIYARTIMELLAKSDNHRAASLSPTGRSAITDWYAVMAIEDYRGVAFGYPDLDWGTDMTNVQFYGLVARALGGQVIVGTELRPGDPSYADVLNNGGDMQEYPDMSALKQLATSYLRAKHPDLIANVEHAFAIVAPGSSQSDVFRFVTAELYAANISALKGTSAQTAIDAVVALTDTLAKESATFESYILASGYTKSSVPAPKSTGF